MTNLKEKYVNEIVPELIKELGYGNVMQVPEVEKITLNMGVGESVTDKKAIEKAQADLESITGQRPLATKAKKSVATYKIREGFPIGCKVTLRKSRMYDFLDRLVNIALPRIRDFRGLNKKSFDGNGNYSIGIKEQIIFPEIDYDSIDKIRGLDITITTTAKTDEEALALLKAFNFPIKDKQEAEEETQDTQEAEEETQDTQEAEEETQDTQEAEEETQEK
jgi:large subunit ribosomal protein L5